MSMLDSLMNMRVGNKPLTSDQKQMNQNNVAKFAGAKAESQVKGMESIFGYCDKSKTSMLKVDDVANIMEEAPGKLANSILLFAKGLGWLTSLSLPNVSRRSSRDSTGGRRMSMEEYDKPNIRRLS